MYIPQGGAAAQKVWRPILVHEVETETPELQWMGESEESGIVVMNELSRTRGEKIEYRFSPTDDTEEGFGEDDLKTGNEAELTFLRNELYINYLALSAKHPGQMSQQRVSVDWREAMYTKLKSKWSRRFSQCWHAQASGAIYADDTSTKRTGNNAVVAIDSDHIFRPSAVANDQSLGSSNILTLALIRQAVNYMSSRDYLDWPVAPCEDGYYHAIMSVDQAEQLRASTTTNEWADIQKSRIEGGQDYNDSALAKAYLGQYYNVKLHVSDFTKNGVHSGTGASVANTRRAVVFGAGFMRLAFGEGYADGQHLDWIEQVSDYDKLGVIANSVFGMQRTVFDSTTYGGIVIPTYSSVA